MLDTRVDAVPPTDTLGVIENGYQQHASREPMRHESILNVFPGASDQQRLVLVKATTMCGRQHFVLRQETHSGDVGWFVQSSIAMEPQQAAALKMTLSPSGLTDGHQSHRTARHGAETPVRATAEPTFKLRFAEAQQAG